VLVAAATAHAGLHYSGEPLAELPSQWRGFLLDYRMLRLVSVKPAGTATPVPLRVRYEQEAAKLAKTAKARPLTPDEAADLGALYLRLGEVVKAIEVLRPAQREHPTHFHLAANLGTAWQLNGDLAQAAATLQLAVRLAPGKWLRAEELHLKLVRQRLRERPGTLGLDDLFGIHYLGPSGKFEAGRIADADRKRLPSDAVALVQQLALWLPADGRLLWQLAELAGAHGDVSTAAAMLEGCVTEFGLRHPDLIAHRQLFRAAAEERGRTNTDDARAAHEGHVATLKPRSSRPLAAKIDLPPLPPVDPKGVNALPWSIISETTLDRQYRPTFAAYLKELDGKQVELTGFMQPLNNEQELESFLLIEYPVGCWYCEAPEVTGIILVELPAGKSRNFTRGQVRVTGRLTLNATDPESFLYVLRNAKVVEAD
jgi:tetratricopeptide (TPR) repeat protein